ncbi:TrmH family RNA methyltransferase [Symbiobacterium terraclitae]|uniref:TrmH family RNA methyltransferase n=1 Tax=Symbiobacterium terraclitae TaxID=557451 RepID=A0ABS4JWC5_9FIRM|nr:RNA methyltransferase [Symbiobacterium terraclitae]MBP2019840.1 TrmH family RNA methyltransferase [Symbiobacterium terraclitae]
MEHGTHPLDAVALVLYQPQDVVNVAAIIRAMSNFGLSDLRLVEPAAFDPYRIAGIAHHTEPLIERTRRFPTLDAALADCGLVLGTTGRPREVARPVYAPRDAAPAVLAGARQRRVAILFGPEQDGLPNAALDRCHGIICIPTHPFNRSLNLAQAALVVAYELWMAAGSADARDAAPAGAEASPPASGAELQALFASVDALLQALYPGGSETRRAQAAARLRALLLRAVPRSEEATALTNLLRHAARASGLRRLDGQAGGHQV